MLLIVVTTLLLIAAVVVEKTCSLPTWGLLLVYLVPYLLIGHDTLKEAAEGLAHGDAFDEHFLMSVATLGALAIGFLPGAENQFPEAVFVMLFFQVGELFEGYAEGKSRDSIAHLMDIRPDAAHVERHGEVQTVVPDQVQPGETITTTIVSGDTASAIWRISMAESERTYHKLLECGWLPQDVSCTRPDALPLRFFLLKLLTEGYAQVHI